ncbi:hypothetical protein [Paenibacillus chitinolyticus]
MTANSQAIKFLETYDLWQQLQEFNHRHVDGQNSRFKDLNIGRKDSSLFVFKSLAYEYEQFVQEEYLSNIMIVINGIDQTLFSSSNKDHLLGNACQRLDSPVFGNRLTIHESVSGLDVLWTPPIPIKIKNYEREKEIIRKNVIHHFDNEFGLMVTDVSLSIITDGTGGEQFFYEHHFLPKKFMEITGIAEHSQQSSPPEDEKMIMSYILEGKTELLKSLVREQLSGPLGFDVQLPDPFIPSDSTVLFMPFFRVCLNIVPDTTATQIIHSVNQKFQVLECSEKNGFLTLVCMAHEGPYAESVSGIVTNIREYLSPHVLQFFNKNALEPASVTFILTDTEY